MFLVLCADILCEILKPKNTQWRLTGLMLNNIKQNKMWKWFNMKMKWEEDFTGWEQTVPLFRVDQSDYGNGHDSCCMTNQIHDE